MKNKRLADIEICCGDPASVDAALAGGAQRIELCSGLSDGGFTPSLALIRYAVESEMPQINVLIRPKTGDFIYNEPEITIMEEDIRTAIMNGATGIAVGALTPDGDIDEETCRRFVTAASEAGPGRHINITFHRAFDLVSDPDTALRQVSDLGFDCILTSGLAPSAEEGIPMLRRLVEKAGGRIAIMAGAGVNPANASRIAASGVNLLHSTARDTRPSLMQFFRREVSMGTPGADEYTRRTTSPAVVAELIKNARS